LSKPTVIVIGAGIIGLAAAHHLQRAGAQVTIVDRDPEGDKASLGNAGGIAVTEVVPASLPGLWWRVPGWLLDPLGPLAVRPIHAPKIISWLTRFARCATPRETERISLAIAALNARVYEDLIPLLEDTGLAGELRRHGALSVYETDEGYARDADEWAYKRSRSIVMQEISGEEARHLEPALGPRVRRAVLTPQWSHIANPKRLVDGIRESLLRSGIALLRDEVTCVAPSVNGALVELRGRKQTSMDYVVVAAGAWSGLLAHHMGDKVLLESERGYNSTLPDAGVTVHRTLVFPEQKFVATPLSCGLRIGGAAEFGGLDAPANFKRSRALVELARRYLPDLRTHGGTHWAGHRPATPDSLPVIGASPCNPRVFYAFGHGHLGLTQAATTGCLITDLIMRRQLLIDMRPYDVRRFI
jgi:D-amino-acid dehydrogenase